jgi:hypothetical protein
MNSTPIGTHFGESGERLRSARSRGLSAQVPVPASARKLEPINPVSKQNGIIQPPEPSEDEIEAQKHIIDDDGDDGNAYAEAGKENPDDIW